MIVDKKILPAMIAEIRGLNDNLPGKPLYGLLLESELSLHQEHTFFGRAERVQKDELFNEGDPLEGRRRRPPLLPDGFRARGQRNVRTETPRRVE